MHHDSFASLDRLFYREGLTHFDKEEIVDDEKAAIDESGVEMYDVNKIEHSEKPLMEKMKDIIQKGWLSSLILVNEECVSSDQKTVG